MRRSHSSGSMGYEPNGVLNVPPEASKSYVRPQSLRVKVGSELVNVVDDPTIPGTYGFYLVDEEGVPARPKQLVVDSTPHLPINEANLG